MKHFVTMIRQAYFANDVDALIPELWAMEGLMALHENMLMAGLVYRDFEEKVAEYGDTVNAHIPASFTALRKADSDEVEVQDAVITNVPVVMNQHVYTSFMIKDGQESKSFKDLFTELMEPAIISIANFVEQALCYELYSFIGNSVGKLGTAPDVDTMIDLRGKMNTNLAPPGNRFLVVPDTIETDLLKADDFHEANKLGDMGLAIREGALGRKLGFDIFMTQNMPSIGAGSTTYALAANGAAAIGDTTIDYDGLSGNVVTVGEWFTAVGDMQPHMITADTGTTLTFTPALQAGVANDAVITVYTAGAVNLVAGYDANYSKDLVIEGFAIAPKQGQLVSFGITTPRYGAMNTPTTIAMLLSKGLEGAVTNDDVVGIGPAGNYGLAFNPKAMALVSRPLALPRAKLADAAVINYNNLSMRVTITYDGAKQGHLVTVDMLLGIKTLNTDLGAPLLG